MNNQTLLFRLKKDELPVAITVKYIQKYTRESIFICNTNFVYADLYSIIVDDDHIIII